MTSSHVRAWRREIIMLHAASPEKNLASWGLVSSLREGVVNLFPTRRTRMAMWGVVGLALLTTLMELAAAKLFGRLITRLGDLTVIESVTFLGGFVLAFFAIKGIAYVQSVYRLTVFERSLRRLVSTSRAAESWRWPLAITLVSMLEQIARLTIVTAAVAVTGWTYGVLLLGCTVAAVSFVNRTGRRQYIVHHEFAAAKKAGNPPSAAERITTRIRAGERAGLVAVGPVLVFIAVLGVGAARGQLSAEDALVMFIAARMAANMYGGLSNATMRFIRAQVNVEAYGGATSPNAGDNTATGAVVPEDELHSMMRAGGYLWEPPSQAFARMIDDGHYLGDMATLGRVTRELELGPNGWLRSQAMPSRQGRFLAVRPNQAWWHQVFVVPLESQASPVYVQVLIDVFSRAILHWRLDDDITDAAIIDLVEEASRLEGVEAGDVDLHATRTLLHQSPNLHDLLLSLGVVRTLTWSTSNAEQDDAAPARPGFPLAFKGREDVETWMRDFVAWYNQRYYQPDIGYLHPHDVHAGLADTIITKRKGTIEGAFANGNNPFHSGVPDTWLPPVEAILQPAAITTVAQDPQTSEEIMLEDDDEEM